MENTAYINDTKYLQPGDYVRIKGRSIHGGETGVVIRQCFNNYSGDNYVIMLDTGARLKVSAENLLMED